MARVINVIDISHHNEIPNGAFATMKAAGLLGVILKSSQGQHMIDNRFLGRVNAAADAGLLVGAYHFLDASDPVSQAKHFVDATYGRGDAIKAPLALWADFEDYGANSASLRQLVEFMKAVDADNRLPDEVVCGLYSGNRIRETLQKPRGGHMDAFMVGVEDFFQHRRLWLAQYGPRAVVPWPWSDPLIKPANDGSDGVSAPAGAAATVPGVFLWQYTESARFTPLPGPTDGNFFDGTPEELKARWLA